MQMRMQMRMQMEKQMEMEMAMCRVANHDPYAVTMLCLDE